MISNNDMTTYMRTPRNVYWEYRNGEYFALKPIEEAVAYVNDVNLIARYKSQLADMDYYTNKWIEGLLTEQEWAEIKSRRANLRQQINDIEAKYQ